MSPVLRIFVFLVVFAVLNVLLLWATASQSLEKVAGMADPVAARKAMREFGQNHVLDNWPLAEAGFTLIAALLAFGAGRRTFVIGGCAAVGVFLYFRLGADVYRAQLQSQAVSSSGAKPSSATPLPSDIAETPQQRAVRLFPDLGVAGSRLHQEFLRRHAQYQKDNRPYFDNPDWPTQLAKESDAAIRF